MRFAAKYRINGFVLKTQGHAPTQKGRLAPSFCNHSLQKLQRVVHVVLNRVHGHAEALDQDRAFLTKGGVFTDSMIDAYIELKMAEVTRFRMAVHPVEYDMYYSL